MLFNKKRLITATALAFPIYQTADGVTKKLSHFDVTDNGAFPVYAKTDEISDEETIAILLGGDGA